MRKLVLIFILLDQTSNCRHGKRCFRIMKFVLRRGKLKIERKEKLSSHPFGERQMVIAWRSGQCSMVPQVIFFGSKTVINNGHSIMVIVNNMKIVVIRYV